MAGAHRPGEGRPDPRHRQGARPGRPHRRQALPDARPAGPRPRPLRRTARRAGVPVVFVDPACTSQQCCECGHIDKKNRASQACFTCRNCGVVAHADRNASHNIARKGVAVWTAGRESRVPATP
ncbi:zinc ribbon domain-containing protein [Streptomyces sp. NPDC056975]|uniref:zinc ribbon domain-containing protein n=1 Tax=unclassified Streptomyces TaxID=2593676 RepID=UPI0036333920